ncbi:MAG: hypothetical protein LBQ16_04090, partial [Gracilibacteraceae bacterium]|nr:hypothetical protein [Gracilibacteraceae bacterium]
IQKTKAPDSFISIAFVAPRSPQWENVRILLNSADELFTHGKVICGLFAKDPRSVSVAHSILEIAFAWKSCHLFVNGVPVFSTKQIKWLPCFTQSLRVSSLTAHCVVAKLRVQYVGERYFQYTVFEPCRFMPAHEWYCEAHPASYVDQFQAMAVRQGVDMCPHFGKFLEERPRKLEGWVDRGY